MHVYKVLLSARNKISVIIYSAQHISRHTAASKHLFAFAICYQRKIILGDVSIDIKMINICDEMNYVI